MGTGEGLLPLMRFPRGGGEMKHYLADNIVATVEMRERQATLNAAAAEKLLTLAAAVRTLPDDDPRVTEIVGFWDRLEANDLGRRWSEIDRKSTRLNSSH